jgi:acetyl esterase/lipase
MRWVLILLVPLVLAACGSQRHAAAPPQFTVHRYGQGPARAWVFAPATRPKLIVLFVHGLGNQKETTPYYHRPWLAHLAREGYEVVYPGYETFPYQQRGLKHLVQGVAAALPHLTTGVPVAAIGYSRGGRLVMDYASVSSVTGLVPGRILSVFPSGIMDPLLNLAPLAGHTKVLILAGDQDTTVRAIGASQLVTQLAASGFPYADVRFETVRSHGAFVADHLSVLNDTPGARNAYWARADRFFAPLARQRFDVK